MRHAAATAASLLLLLSSQTAESSVFRYLSFGDSITEGFNDSASCTSCPNPAKTPPGCGYPKDTRLPSASMLNCAANNCAIVNEGKSSEQTGPGITRLNQILNGDPNWDVLILMHGSNDLFVTPPLPEETVRDNVKQMAHDAAERGIDTVHASVIRFHYLGTHGTSRDGLVDQYGTLVQSLASSENRYFSDQRAALCGTATGGTYFACQNFFYCEDNPFGAQKYFIGHPGPAGFDTMAQTFANTINQMPAPGAPAPEAPSGDLCTVPPTLRWTKESPDRATWYHVQVETNLGASVFEDWFPEANISAINTDPLIPGVCSGTSCSVTMPAALTPGDYVLRVRGRNPRGRSAFSADLSFDGTPDDGTGDYPEGDVVVQTPTYRWLESEGATGYVLEGTIPPTSTAGFTCSGGVCSVKPASPVLGLGSYTWSVRPSNSCGSAAASPAKSFSVIACGNPGPFENQVVTTTETEIACNTIEAGNFGAGDYGVGSTGVLSFHAGVAVELHNGFFVDNGGELTILTDL